MDPVLMADNNDHELGPLTPGVKAKTGPFYGSKTSLESENPGDTVHYDQLVIPSTYLSKRTPDQLRKIRDEDRDRRKYRVANDKHVLMDARRRRNQRILQNAVKSGDYSKLMKRTCLVYSQHKSSTECFCGKPKDDHKEFSKEPWSATKNTELSRSDAYGRLEFPGSQRSKYARLDCESSPEVIKDLLLDVWKLPRPGVLISVLGSLLDFKLTVKLEKIIQRGLIRAAVKTDGWITTPGIDSGFVKTVGKALKLYGSSAYCIGIASWGCLPTNARKALQNRNSDQSRKDKVSYPNDTIPPGMKFQHLEHNHGYFLLADDGATGHWDAEYGMRSEFEAYMQNTMNIPVVAVLIKGMWGASHSFRQLIDKGVPAVLVKGSGGLADLLCELKRHQEELDRLYADSNSPSGRTSTQLRRIKTMEFKNADCSCEESFTFECNVVKNIWSRIFTTKMSEIWSGERFFSDVTAIIEKKVHLIVFDMEGDHFDGFDAALLTALVRAQSSKEESEKQLHVALRWNRPEIAKKILEKTEAIAGKDPVELGKILVHAMVWKHKEFIELLIENGASLEMAAANLDFLYENCVDTSHLKRYIKFHLNVFHHTSERVALTEKHINKLVNSLIGKSNKFEYAVTFEHDPHFELMVWAALTLSPDIAERMWQGTLEPIRAALFVVLLMRKLKMKDKVLINTNEIESCTYMIERFETLAIKVLDKLYHENPDYCTVAINSRWLRLDNKTYMEMARKCSAKRFIAHNACRELCENRWRGLMTDEVGILGTLLVFLFPFILLTNYITFKSNLKYLDENMTVAVPKWRYTLRKFTAFYSSPNVKFTLGVIFFTVFVLLQTCLVLSVFDVQAGNFKYKIILYIWLGSLIIDELIQARLGKEWLKETWNRADMFMLIIDLIGFILVNIPSKDDPDKYDVECYNIGRIFLGIASVLFFIRLIYMFINDKTLGPTIIMIYEMSTDFKNFLFLFIVVMVGFGIGYLILLSDPSGFNADVAQNVKAIFFYSYFQMYGELFVDDLTMEEPTFVRRYKGTFNTSEWKYWRSFRGQTAILFVAVYMAIAVLMLVNVLIAMFSDTFRKVKDNESVIWKFQRLELLMNTEKSFLPPPISIVQFLVYKIRKLVSSKTRIQDNLKEKWKTSFDTVIRSSVIDSLEDYLKDERNLENSKMDSLLKHNVEGIKRKMNALANQIKTLEEFIKDNID